MMNGKPLSYYTNRIAIVFIILFFMLSCILVFIKQDHRSLIISLLITLSGTVGLLIVTIASPNKQIDWIDQLLNKKE
ncbi:MAG: hypothetical protein ACRCWI_07695 [Brevinema sp.]